CCASAEVFNPGAWFRCLVCTLGVHRLYLEHDAIGGLSMHGDGDGGVPRGRDSDRAADGRRANRLIDAMSPYLRQHAYNPVDWFPWGPEALARAKAENKPILLSIGYSA